MKRGILLFMVFFISESFGISKVGNSVIGSQKTGFQTGIPYPFFDTQVLKSEGMRLRSVVPENHIVPGSGSIVSYIEMNDFDSMFDLSYSTRDEARADFLAKGWKELETKDSCHLSMIIENNSAVTSVSLWGPQKGLVAFGIKTSNVRSGLKQIVDNLTIEPGACAW